jgi:hypothetical protein
VAAVAFGGNRCGLDGRVQSDSVGVGARVSLIASPGSYSVEVTGAVSGFESRSSKGTLERFRWGWCALVALG